MKRLGISAESRNYRKTFMEILELENTWKKKTKRRNSPFFFTLGQHQDVMLLLTSLSSDHEDTQPEFGAHVPCVVEQEEGQDLGP